MGSHLELLEGNQLCQHLVRTMSAATERLIHVHRQLVVSTAPFFPECISEDVAHCLVWTGWGGGSFLVGNFHKNDGLCQR